MKITNQEKHNEEILFNFFITMLIAFSEGAISEIFCNILSGYTRTEYYVNMNVFTHKYYYLYLSFLFTLLLPMMIFYFYP